MTKATERASGSSLSTEGLIHALTPICAPRDTGEARPILIAFTAQEFNLLNELWGELHNALVDEAIRFEKRDPAPF